MTKKNCDVQPKWLNRPNGSCKYLIGKRAPFKEHGNGTRGEDDFYYVCTEGVDFVALSRAMGKCKCTEPTIIV